MGLVKQGLKCERCNLNFHKKCAYAPRNECGATAPMETGSGESAVTGQPLNDGFGLPHTFVVHSYKKPTVCKLCNNLLVGIIKQGLQCRDCKVGSLVQLKTEDYKKSCAVTKITTSIPGSQSSSEYLFWSVPNNRKARLAINCDAKVVKVNVHKRCSANMRNDCHAATASIRPSSGSVDSMETDMIDTSATNSSDDRDSSTSQSLFSLIHATAS